ncbi:DUF2971 domain-containing protein [Novosphingobium colocasiae]|uniref:DUF2971 domain-containing protein n=1 Tax=Novosphingobium colocasiae TaxID=1256513 RepID=UPI0035B2F477
MKQRERLFKFCRPTDNALHNLEAGHLFCQHYTAYNDPFEFWTTVSKGIPDPEREPERYIAALGAWGFDCRTVDEAKKDEIISGSVDDYFDECLDYALPFDTMRQEIRISCFSAQSDNLLMWSHYADGLRGFCIAFDEEVLTQGSSIGYVVDVAYLNAPPRVDSFVYAVARDQDWYSRVAIEETEAAIKYQGKAELAGEIAMYKESGARALRTMREIWQQVFAAKPAQWQYECERRLLVQTGRDDAAPVLQSYDRGAIKEVILGERMPDEYRARILAVMQGVLPDVPLKTARRSRESYSIVIE